MGRFSVFLVRYPRTERFVLFMFFFLIGFVVALLDSTVPNLNKGSQIGLLVDDINYPIEAEVLSCEEYGPVNFRTGFGYWTHCEVEYRDQYLVSTKATVTRSILSVEDVGTTVDLWVTCNHLHEKCTVGNEPSELVAFLAILPRTATVPLGWGFLAVSPIFLFNVFWPGRNDSDELVPMKLGPSVPEEIVVAEDESRIVVWFGHPLGTSHYRAPSPRMEIDGGEVRVLGWGTQVFLVSPGIHRLKVWIPYGIPRSVGRAAIEVDVPANGGRVELEYMAPKLSFAKGAMRVRGGQDE